jgi:polyhydroxyalkanoate synthesis regulator phasin
MSENNTQNGVSGRPYQGQGLLEYSLTGVLVLLVCVGGLEIFTGEMSKTWQKLWDDMKSRQGPAVAITAPPSPLVPSAPLPKPPSVDEGLPLAGKKFVTQKGTVITLPDTVDTMEETIRTLGANGTTTILANSLEALIKQLVANSELDRAQAQNLMTLANKGHAIAKAQKLTEEAILNTRTSEEFMTILESDPSLSLNINGTVYHSLGGYSYNDSSDPLQPDLTSWGATGDFLNAYHAAVASGALNDSAIRTVVDTLARKISILSISSVSTFISFSGDEISQSEVSGNIAENVAKTHDKSAQICTTGKGQDSGTQCATGG